jgi:magnesium transporter
MIREIKNNDITWVNIVNPNKNAVHFLREKYHIAPGVLRDFLPAIKRPKVEDYGDYLFVVIHFPIFNPDSRTTTSTELDIIIFRDTLITSHYSHLPELKRVFEKCEKDMAVKNYYMQKDAVCMLYLILDKLIDTRMPMLDHIDDHIDAIEAKMFIGDERKLLQEIAFVKHDIIGFRKSLKPQRSVLESLSHFTPKISPNDYRREITEVIGSNIKAWNTLENHKEMIEALEQTNESIFSHKLNDTMKILTAFSVMVLPLTLIASIFGMNTTVGMPFMQEEYGFEIILCIMMSVSVFCFAYFKYKRWM